MHVTDHHNVGMTLFASTFKLEVATLPSAGGLRIPGYPILSRESVSAMQHKPIINGEVKVIKVTLNADTVPHFTAMKWHAELVDSNYMAICEAVLQMAKNKVFVFMLEARKLGLVHKICSTMELRGLSPPYHYSWYRGMNTSG